ncbi:UDP-glucosyltransferase 2-like [Galleria mellonella]|uniref:UDP-glucosyltransferase 2-like n=1 Tax=Galleria mellonella TaxID=7137 RepID=A0ABM3N0A7_GALME|nr:UDP-glucosyltransferase 2-like [Galleria mellonella]
MELLNGVLDIHFALLTACNIIEAAKILAVFPTPSISHQVVFRPLTRELAARGHEVVVITPFPAYPAGGGPANLTEIDVGHTVPIYREGKIAPSYNHDADIRAFIETLLPLGAKVVFEQLQTVAVSEIIKNKDIKFDLLIIEAWVRPDLAFSHRFNVPVIRLASIGPFLNEYGVMGDMGHPLYHPTCACSRCPDVEKLTYMDMIYEIYNYLYINKRYCSLEDEEVAMLRTYFGPDMPTLNELSNNVDLLVVNTHHAWELNRPLPLSVVHVGGIHLKSNCSLPEDLKRYLDNSENGVLYVSFGTNMKPSWFHPKTLEVMVKVISQLPFDILWKWDEEKLPAHAKNIKVAKWFPQECLLRHPKIKLFVTQGGLQSTEEAIAAGVPLVGIPINADQYTNTQYYVRYRIGVKVLMNNLTQESLREAIYTVLNDESYRRNIVRLRALLHDERLPPLARAVWWTEHVLRHAGTPYLRAPAANMHWAHYHQLDLIVLLAALALLACCTVYTGAKILLRLTTLRRSPLAGLECLLHTPLHTPGEAEKAICDQKQLQLEDHQSFAVWVPNGQ